MVWGWTEFESGLTKRHWHLRAVALGNRTGALSRDARGRRNAPSGCATKGGWRSRDAVHPEQDQLRPGEAVHHLGGEGQPGISVRVPPGCYPVHRRVVVAPGGMQLGDGKTPVVTTGF